ncbi:hypothetical protein DFH09DRAFT_1068971 [Mycena vulgaris]|nr:hypothetical protein DFH09DRAFT_1068971 [Mycena vulgaris]
MARHLVKKRTEDANRRHKEDADKNLAEDVEKRHAAENEAADKKHTEDVEKKPLEDAEKKPLKDVEKRCREDEAEDKKHTEDVNRRHKEDTDKKLTEDTEKRCTAEGAEKRRREDEAKDRKHTEDAENKTNRNKRKQLVSKNGFVPLAELRMFWNLNHLLDVRQHREMGKDGIGRRAAPQQHRRGCPSQAECQSLAHSECDDAFEDDFRVEIATDSKTQPSLTARGKTRCVACPTWLSRATASKPEGDERGKSRFHIREEDRKPQDQVPTKPETESCSIDADTEDVLVQGLEDIETQSDSPSKAEDHQKKCVRLAQYKEDIKCEKEKVRLCEQLDLRDGKATAKKVLASAKQPLGEAEQTLEEEKNQWQEGHRGMVAHFFTSEAKNIASYSNYYNEDPEKWREDLEEKANKSIDKFLKFLQDPKHLCDYSIPSTLCRLMLTIPEFAIHSGTTTRELALEVLSTDKDTFKCCFHLQKCKQRQAACVDGLTAAKFFVNGVPYTGGIKTMEDGIMMCGCNPKIVEEETMKSDVFNPRHWALFIQAFMKATILSLADIYNGPDNEYGTDAYRFNTAMLQAGRFVGMADRLGHKDETLMMVKLTGNAEGDNIALAVLKVDGARLNVNGTRAYDCLDCDHQLFGWIFNPQREIQHICCRNIVVKCHHRISIVVEVLNLILGHFFAEGPENMNRSPVCIPIVTANETQTLRVCALVGQLWRHPAKACIFRTISLGVGLQDGFTTGLVDLPTLQMINPRLGLGSENITVLVNVFFKDAEGVKTRPFPALLSSPNKPRWHPNLKQFVHQSVPLSHTAVEQKLKRNAPTGTIVSAREYMAKRRKQELDKPSVNPDSIDIDSSGDQLAPHPELPSLTSMSYVLIQTSRWSMIFLPV